MKKQFIIIALFFVAVLASCNNQQGEINRLQHENDSLKTIIKEKERVEQENLEKALRVHEESVKRAQQVRDSLKSVKEE